MRDAFIQIDDPWRQHLLAGEGEQALGQLGAAPGCLARQPDARQTLRIITNGVFEQLQAAENDRQEIVEIVRHAARELADRVHLLGLRQLLLTRPAFRDIENESESDAAAVLARLDLDDVANPRDPAVRAQDSVFEILVARPLIEEGRVLAGRLAVFRQDHRQPLFLIFEDFGTNTQDAFDLRPDIEEAPRVDVPGVGYDIGRLDKMAETALALLERELGSAAVGDIEPDAHDVADLSRAIPDGRPNADPAAELTVRPAVVRFIEAVRLPGLGHHPIALFNRAQVLCGVYVGHRFALEPLDRTSHIVRLMGIDEDIVALQILDRHGCRYGIDDRPQQTLAFANDRLGLFPVGNVEASADDVLHPSLVVAQRDLSGQPCARSPGVVTIFFLEERRCLAGSYQALLALADLPGVRVRKYILSAFADQQFSRLAKLGRHVGIHQDVAAIGILDVDRQRHGIDDRPQQVSALSHCRFIPLPLGDIERDADDVLRRCRLALDRHIARKPVRLAPIGFRVDLLVGFHRPLAAERAAVPLSQQPRVVGAMDIFNGFSGKPIRVVTMVFGAVRIDEDIPAVGVGDTDQGRNGINDGLQESFAMSRLGFRSHTFGYV